MAIGPDLSNRWTARKDEFEAWSALLWLGAKRRVAARWMPLAATTAIFAVLLLFQAIDALPAIASVAALFVAAAFWPLDSTVLIEALAGTRPVDADGRDARARPQGLARRRRCDPTPAVALDAAGTVVHHNRLVAELFPKIENGQPVSQVTRNPDLIAAVDRALAAEERINVELIERVPVERRVSATVSRLAPSAEPSSPYLLVTFRDLTEQDRLAQMRADFIANASHELRTPLASLRAFVETLQGPAREDVAARDALPAAHGEPGRAHDAADRRPLVAEPRGDARAPAAARHRRSQRDRCLRVPVARARCRAMRRSSSRSSATTCRIASAVTARRSCRSCRT